MAREEIEPKQSLTVSFFPTENLLLDAENPRLASSVVGDSPSQTELIQVLWTEMAVEELVLSISANGYFEEEPLFIVPSTEDKEKYIVVEGNRRLAAVKLLLDNDLRRELKTTKIPELSDQEKQGLEQLPAYVYANREELWEFLSFRHINSPQEWDPYSKAKYVVKVHDEYKVDLEEIARKIGDTHETVKRLYRGYKVLAQAQDEDIYNINDRYGKKFFFSHWYTALSYAQFQEFLGIGPEDFERAKPVPKSKYPEMQELLAWIFGKKAKGEVIEPVIKTQNPDLNNLRDVLANEDALANLRRTHNLTRSYEISVGDQKRFRDSLANAKEELVQANGVVELGYEGEDDLFKVITDIGSLSRALKKAMDEKRSSGD